MDILEYDSRKQRIEANKLMQLQKLYREYVESYPGRLKVGDIATDRITGESIRVSSIKIRNLTREGRPQPEYYGVRVKKDGTPFVNNQHLHIIHCRTL